MSEIKALEKLRESSHLDDSKWSLETGEVIHVFGYKPEDPNAVNWGEQWRKIADEIQNEVDSHFCELPVDADGVPIRVGDELFNKNKPTDVYKVSAIAGNGYIRIYHDTAHIHSSQCRHVKPDPLKELLSELANEVWEASCTCQTTWSDSGLDGIEERYANRIRELMKEGGE